MRGAAGNPVGQPKFCLYSPASRGGAGWFVFALAEAIGRAGAPLLLIAPEAVPADREPASANITRLVLIAGKAGKAPLPVRIARTLWRIASTFPALLRARLATREIIVTMYDWVPVLVLQFLWIKLLGGRLTFVVHDATPHAWAFPKPLRGLERALFRLSYRLPDRIISLTGALQRELAEQWGRSERSWVIPHGAFIHGSSVPMPGDDVVLVFGMLRRNKHILESIEAMRTVAAEMPGLRMVIAGGPHAEDRGYWDECEAALVGLEAIIRTEIGFVPEARLETLLGECDALLLPYEQFNSQSGVAVLAGFSERIVIASNAGGIGELIDLGLEAVPLGRPITADVIADGLRRFAAIPLAERRRMAQDSREKLAGVLSWDRIGRDYVALLCA